MAGDFNAPSDGAALAAFATLGYRDLLPGGIDHVLLSPAAGWQARSVTWTLRREDVEAALGVAAEISDHPGILVELVRIPPDG